MQSSAFMQEIDRLNTIVEGMNQEGQARSWVCWDTTNGTRSVRVLSDREYQDRPKTFWGKTGQKLSLGQVAAYVNQQIVSALENSFDKEGAQSIAADLKSFDTCHTQLVTKLTQLREKAIKKIDDTSWVTRIFRKMWYWFFDPKNKITELGRSNKYDLLNHAFTAKIDLVLLKLIKNSNDLWGDDVNREILEIASMTGRKHNEVKVGDHYEGWLSVLKSMLKHSSLKPEGKAQLQACIKQISKLNKEWWDSCRVCFVPHYNKKRFICLS